MIITVCILTMYLIQMAHEGGNNKEDKGGNNRHKWAQMSTNEQTKVGTHIRATPAAWPWQQEQEQR